MTSVEEMEAARISILQKMIGGALPNGEAQPEPRPASFLDLQHVAKVATGKENGVINGASNGHHKNGPVVTVQAPANNLKLQVMSLASEHPAHVLRAALAMREAMDVDERQRPAAQSNEEAALLTIEQVGQKMHISRTVAYAMVKSGQIPPHCVVQVGNSKRIRASLLNAWLRGTGKQL